MRDGFIRFVDFTILLESSEHLGKTEVVKCCILGFDPSVGGGKSRIKLPSYYYWLE